MADGNAAPRYLIDSYREWALREGVPIIEGVAVDLNASQLSVMSNTKSTGYAMP